MSNADPGDAAVRRPGLRRRLAGAAGVLLALAVIAGVALRYVPARGNPAPEAVVTRIDSGPLALSSLRGRVVLVNFWATTCAVCLREMPRLTELYRRHHPRGYDMVAVAMPYDPPHRVLDYARRTGLPFIVALDLDGSAVRAFGNVSATPATFLIDRRGMVVREYVGEPDFAELERLIAKALGER